ncbi:hypothetical protein CJF42_24990 [Pseudoalteromonas sp. NBT06-2]|uniref:hypothetical protein n=1 Tax=Pseudoalteromonas sp. NBT06-2 TaxID=2025950 RepID=UPI000BCD25CF|nr:hypothetical protein [Pseudoalteromonas sp. NBT06-2]PAJ71753.1 hypothetical protein CJF42_24990 [Pseudoalteromonas sp. NBT06-2]
MIFGSVFSKREILQARYILQEYRLNIRVILISAILCLFFVMSIYYYQFGIGFWSDHTKWAELGSFFGGILGPIFAFFTLLYLAFQVEMQWKESKAARIESEVNNRENYISTNLQILMPKLSAIDSSKNAPMAEIILRMHRDENLDKDNLQLIKLGLSARAETLVVWVNIAAALSYLKAVDENRYLNQLTIVTVQIGQELCSALDRVVRLATDINFEHHFQV